MHERNKNRKIISIGINIILYILLWYLLSLNVISKGTIPMPHYVLKIIFSSEIIELISRLLISLKTVIIVLFLSSILGYLIGLLIGLNNKLFNFIYPILNSIKSIPVTVFLPVFIVIFHLKYFLYPMISLPLIANLGVNIAQSVISINNNRLITIKQLNINKKNYIIHIVFWETLSPLLSTMRIIITYALTIEIAIDYFLNIDGGIGGYISDKYNSMIPYKYSYIFAGITIISIVGIYSIKLLDNFSKKHLKWKEQI